MVAIPTYHLPVEVSTNLQGSDRINGGKAGGGDGGGRETKSISVNIILDYLLSDFENSTDITSLDKDIAGLEETTTEFVCPRRGASPEHLKKLQVVTLVVIGLVGLLIVSFLLLCMFYKNERLLEKMPWRKNRVKKVKESESDLTAAINTSLQAVPSMRITTSALDYLTKNKGKHFPTHKTMLVDIGCRMAAGGAIQIPLGISPGSSKRSDIRGPLVRTTRLSSGVYEGNSRNRNAINDSLMRRHHNPQYPGIGLSASNRPPMGAEGGGGRGGPAALDDDDDSEYSWFSEEESENSDPHQRDDSLGDIDEEEELGGTATESRRGARGEKWQSLRVKDKYMDQYGSSMTNKASARQSDETPVSMPHEVSYMSGRFW